MDIRNRVIAKQIALLAELSFRLEALKLKPTPREIALTDELNDLYDRQESDAQTVAETDAKIAIGELCNSLDEVVTLIEKAGVYNLSNGVQLGPTVWCVKMNDAVEHARKLVPRKNDC